jgi:hypothetical protein
LSASHLQTKAGPIHPNNINLTHSGRAKVSVSVRCLVLVQIYGNSPRKLFVKIIRNTEVRTNEFAFFSSHFLKCSAPPCGAPTPQACNKRQFSAPRAKAAVYKLCGYKDSFCSQKKSL